MRKLILVPVAVCVPIVLAVGVSLMTFDADRFRPLVVGHLERALGEPVRLDHLGLGWRQGIALRLDGFAIGDGAAAGREPLLHVDSASAFVHPLALLRKEVRVSSMVLESPRIHVSRDAQGRSNVLGIAVAAGPAAASGDTVAVGEAAVSFNIQSLRIEDGALHWTDAMARPPTELWLKQLDVTATNIAPGQPMDVDVSGALAGETPNLRLSGRLTLPRPQGGAGSAPALVAGGTGRPGLAAEGSLERMQLTIERLPLEDVLPAVPPGEPQLRGQLTVTVQGSAATLDPARWTQGLSGSGRVKVHEPVVANLNVLRAVFEKFAMIPGLVETLQARLPADYQVRLAARDTVLGPIDLSMTLDAGAMRFDDLAVQTDTFGMSGTGRVGLDGTIDLQATLRIEPAFSAALIRSVNELQALTNAKGEMEIPLIIRGQAPRVAVLPDVQYVASKVLVTKAVDLLGGLLRTQQQAPSGEAATDQADGPEGELLGQVLQRVLKR